MKELIIKTQKELDKVKPDFDGYIYIEGGTDDDPLVLRKKFDEAYVISRGTAHLILDNDAVLYQMWGSSQVNVMRESSQVNVMRESSQVNEMWGSSQVKEMRESSQVKDLYGEAMVSAMGMNKLVCHGYNIVRTHKSNKKNLTLVMNKDSHLILIPDFKATFSDFAKRYPVNTTKTKAILYKAVHKIDGKYFSDYVSGFQYEVGKTYTEKIDPKSYGSCARGLHLAHLSWAKNFGCGWNNIAILECETLIKDVIVAEDCDGKVRTSKLKVLREVEL